jgi:hypothetical protein
VVFTKFDQFRREIRLRLEDQGRDTAFVNDEIERVFKEQFLANLKVSLPIVRLEGEAFYQLAFVTLIAVVQGCTSMEHGVRILLKRLLMRSPTAPLLSYSYLFRRTTWS